MNFPSLKTNAEFRKFHDDVLIHKIRLLETLRQEDSQKIRKVMFIATLIIITISILLLLSGIKVDELFAIIIYISIGVAILAGNKIKAIKNKRASDENREDRMQRIIRRLNFDGEELSDYETAFYTQIISPIVTFVSDKLEYNQQFISMDIFIASGLFPKPDKYSGSIELRGVIGQDRFIFSEVETYSRPRSEHFNPNPRSRPIYDPLFTGLFYKTNFSKKLKGGNIYLLPSSIADRLGGRMDVVMCHQYDICKNNVQIRFIDEPDFRKSFSVFAEDSKIAYHTLTPSLRRFLVEIQQQFKDKKIYCSFIQGEFYLAIENENLGFKPSLNKTLLDYSKIEKHFERIRWVLEISQDFKKVMQ